MTAKSPTTQMRCPTCGHIGPAPSGGVILRIDSGTRRRVVKRVLKRCPVCDRLRFQILERVGAVSAGAAADAVGGATPSRAGGADADRERTLQELAAYVSEGTMDIETAEAVAGSTAPEQRKREIAAHVAEGALDASQARRLLAL